MGLLLSTAPAIEPVTRTEAKEHMRLDTTSDDISSEQSIVPGDHVIAAAYTLEGATVDVLGFIATAFLDAGDCAAGEVDVKLQDSPDDIVWTDVPSGAFTQVTAANDNAIQEIAYTGDKQYLRAVATVASGTCDFSASVTKQALTTDEDDLIDSLIVAARQWAENFTRRAFITQSWTLTLDAFPTEILLPRPLAITVTTLKYFDTDGVQQTWNASNYTVDIANTPGKVVRAFNIDWPNIRNIPNTIEVIYTAGYGAAASDVPDGIKLAIKMLVGHWYEHRESVVLGVTTAEVPMAVESILWPYRVLDYRLDDQGY